MDRLVHAHVIRRSHAVRAEHGAVSRPRGRQACHRFRKSSGGSRETRTARVRCETSQSSARAGRRKCAGRRPLLASRRRSRRRSGGSEREQARGSG